MRPTPFHVVVAGVADTPLLFESFDVDRVSTPSDAAALVSGGTDCVVVDGSTADRGLAIVDAVRAVDESVPVAYTTADADGYAAAAGTRAGATEYVVRNAPDEPSLVERVAALAADGRGADSNAGEASARERERERETETDTETDREHEHERHRRELERTTESLERAIERIDDAFFALDEEWRFTLVNEQAAALIGVDGSSLLGERLWDEFPDTVGSTFEEQYRHAMDEQESVTFEEYFPPLDSWFEVAAYPSESGLSVSFSDVTGRKEMERELRESEAKFRQFAENLEEVVWMSSVGMDELHYVNPAYEDLWGRSRQSVYDEPLSFLEGIHPDDRERAIETIPQRTRGEYDEEFRVVRPDGTVRWVRDRATPIHDEDGEVFRVVGIAEDVTERRAREQELKRYQRIIETIGDGVVVADADQRITHVNEAYAGILGLEREDLIGTHASSLVDDETWDEWTTIAAEMAAGETTHATVETDLPVEDGIVPIEAHVTALTATGSGEDEFVWLGRDITRRREREETVRRLLETTQALFACEGPGDVAAVVADAASEVFGYDFVGVRLYDDETDELVLEAATDSVFDDVTDRGRVGVEAGAEASPITEAFTRGEPIVIDDVRTASPYDYGDLRGAMCIPLADAGVLAIGSPTEGAFDDADVQLAQLLTTSAGAALESATRQAALVRHEQVLETVEGMVYAVDEEARFTLVTEPFAARLGYDREALLGEHVSIVLEDADIDRGTDHIRQLLAEPRRESTTFETNFHPADADEFPAEVEISLLPFDETFRGTVGAVRDITERKERERYLQVLNRVLRHNLRNDLTVVLGYADRLASEVDDDELAGVATTLHDIAVDLAELSEDAKRIEHALRQGQVDGKPIPLSTVVTVVLERGGDDEGWNEASIDVDVPDDVVVRADEQLATVLANLVDNAVEHATHEEPRVCIRARADEDVVTLSVEDDGPGIPRDEREIITGERDITQLSHGSGLGLWLVRWIVDSYGGEVSFHRSDLGGSRVTVSLERARLAVAS